MTAPLLTVSSAPGRIWREALDTDPNALVTQTPGWLEAVTAGGEWLDASHLYEWEDGTRVVLPMVRRATAPAETASWPPDWGVGGPLCPDGPPTLRQAAEVFDHLTRHPGHTVYLRPNPLTPQPWTQAAPAGARRNHRVTHIVDLRTEHGGWERRVHPAARRGMRKAERCGLEVTRGNSPAEIAVFYGLYRQSMTRWAAQDGKPADEVRQRIEGRDPERKLLAVARALGSACSVWTAWWRGEPAASVILLRHGRHAKYWRGAMDKALAAPTRANLLLHQLALADAALSGCAHYHMGDSRPGTGVARFKESLGAVPHPSPGYWLDRDTDRT